MITRRTVAVGATGFILAPAVVRAEVLMRLRGVIPPIEPVYYGFLDRLRLYTEHGIVLPKHAYSYPSIFLQGTKVREGAALSRRR